MVILLLYWLSGHVKMYDQIQAMRGIPVFESAHRWSNVPQIRRPVWKSATAWVLALPRRVGMVEFSACIVELT